MFSALDVNSVNSVSQLIQLSVAPVFLLAGVAGLLNVFTGRLSRIIDKVDKLDKYEDQNILRDERKLWNLLKEESSLQWEWKTQILPYFFVHLLDY